VFVNDNALTVSMFALAVKLPAPGPSVMGEDEMYLE
jgi:hypothetical protein